MSFYEAVFIIRQDVASTDVDKVIVEFEKLINDFGGLITKKEYWGLRQLAYEIKNNKKGHYFFLGLSGNNEMLNELNRKVKLSESIIRFNITKVNSISDKPSPILNDSQENDEETVDVTISKENI